jgi:hypothetical protein
VLTNYVQHYDGETITNQTSGQITVCQPYDLSFSRYSVVIPMDRNGVCNLQVSTNGVDWRTYKAVHVSFTGDSRNGPLCCTNDVFWHAPPSTTYPNPAIEFYSPLNFQTYDPILSAGFHPSYIPRVLTRPFSVCVPEGSTRWWSMLIGNTAPTSCT